MKYHYEAVSLLGRRSVVSILNDMNGLGERGYRRIDRIRADGSEVILMEREVPEAEKSSDLPPGEEEARDALIDR